MSHKQLAVKLLLCGLTAAAIAGCKKDFNEKLPLPQVNENKVFRKPETPQEKALVANLEKITSVLKEIYGHRDVVKEVNAALYARVYSDESVLLRDLIFPEMGLVARSVRFRELAAQWQFTPGNFANAFLEAAAKKKDPLFDSFLSIMKGASGIRTAEYPVEQVSIYHPYSNEYLEPVFDNNGSSITTLVTASADADEGIGYLSYNDEFGAQQYRQVVVNDTYAAQNPTHIIGVNGIEPVLHAATTVNVFKPSGPIDIADLDRPVQQVYIGEVKCTRQYDRLISFTGNGGGSEIRITRHDGYLKLADGQVQADMLLVAGPHKVERGDIRDGKWIDWTAVWDNDWEPNNLEQSMAIFEEDNRNTLTISGNVKTTLKINDTVTVEGTISFSINHKSDDALIFQTTYKHDVFFALNRFDQEGEMRNGWPVRNRNSPVSFTFLDRTLH